METRQVTQVKLYYLLLNSVYDCAEARSIAAVSADLDELISFYKNNLLSYDERFRDNTGMYRSFREGILYNYNPLPFDVYSEYVYDDLGIKSCWVDEDQLYKYEEKYPWVGTKY